MTYWCYNEESYFTPKQDGLLYCAPTMEEEFFFHGLSYETWTIECKGSSPLERVSKCLAAIRRRQIGIWSDTFMDDELRDIEGITWVEDRVLFYKQPERLWLSRRGQKGPVLPTGFFVTYPRTTVGECMSCGSPCDVYLGCCVRCKPVLSKILKEVKHDIEIIEDIKDSKKLISKFTEKLNERHRPAKNKTARALGKV